MRATQPDHSYWYTSPELWAKLKPLARENRHEPTPAEKRLWTLLRNRKVSGVKFRRQYPIERFIVDFFAVKARLVVEVDGPYHMYTGEEDLIRQAFLESLGLKVIRFTNQYVMTNPQGVVTWITENANGGFRETG
jgi:very-short-patch-repair endonuclease